MAEKHWIKNKGSSLFRVGNGVIDHYVQSARAQSDYSEVRRVGMDETLHRLCGYRLKTVRAYLLKLALQDVYFAPSREAATIRLKNWNSWAIRSQIEQVRGVAKTVKNHWYGILSWFNSQLSNGFLEAVNGLIQAAKRRARGYRTTKNLINMDYLIAGKLDFRLPT